jgi:hypothetical protein
LRIPDDPRVTDSKEGWADTDLRLETAQYLEEDFELDNRSANVSFTSLIVLLGGGT